MLIRHPSTCRASNCGQERRPLCLSLTPGVRRPRHHRRRCCARSALRQAHPSSLWLSLLPLCRLLGTQSLFCCCNQRCLCCSLFLPCLQGVSLYPRPVCFMRPSISYSAIVFLCFMLDERLASVFLAVPSLFDKIQLPCLSLSLLIYVVLFFTLSQNEVVWLSLRIGGERLCFKDNCILPKRTH